MALPDGGSTSYDDELLLMVGELKNGRCAKCLSEGGLVLGILLVCAAATPAKGREPVGRAKPPARAQFGTAAPIPFSPDEFMKGIFGPAAEDDKALEGVEVSRDEESRIGNAAADAYLSELRRQKLEVTTRGKEVDYLRDLVETLRPLMRNKDRYPTIDVHLVDSRQSDARSFPGGTLVFYRGLFDLAESEAALVGVVGHELSHLDHGHQLREVKRVKLAEQAFAGGQAFSPERLMSVGRTLAAGWTRPFKPEDEEQADRDGATWAFQAGYDPRELAALFLRMQQRDQNAGNANRRDNKGAARNARNANRGDGDQASAAIGFFRTHPFHIDRARAIEALSRDRIRQAPDKRLYVGQQNLRVRTARLRREFPE